MVTHKCCETKDVTLNWDFNKTKQNKKPKQNKETNKRGEGRKKRGREEGRKRNKE